MSSARGAGAGRLCGRPATLPPPSGRPFHTRRPQRLPERRPPPPPPPSPGSTPSAAIDYPIVAARTGELPPDDVLDQPFDLPGPATVAFAIANRSTDEPDLWDIGIFTDAEFRRFQADRPATAYGWQQNVSARQAMAELPEGGRYHLGVRCRNSYQPCIFTFSLTAHY